MAFPSSATVKSYFSTEFYQGCGFELRITSVHRCNILGTLCIRSTKESEGRFTISSDSKAVIAKWEQNASSLHIHLTQQENATVDGVLFVPNGPKSQDFAIYTNCLHVKTEDNLKFSGHARIETTHGSIQASLEVASKAKSTSVMATDVSKRNIAIHGTYGLELNMDRHYRVLLCTIAGDIDCSICAATMSQLPISIKTQSDRGNTTIQLLPEDNGENESSEAMAQVQQAISTMVTPPLLVAKHTSVCGNIVAKYPHRKGTLFIRSKKNEVNGTIANSPGLSEWQSSSSLSIISTSTIDMSTIRGTATFLGDGKNLHFISHEEIKDNRSSGITSRMNPLSNGFSCAECYTRSVR